MLHVLVHRINLNIKKAFPTNATPLSPDPRPQDPPRIFRSKIHSTRRCGVGPTRPKTFVLPPPGLSSPGPFGPKLLTSTLRSRASPNRNIAFQPSVKVRSRTRRSIGGRRLYENSVRNHWLTRTCARVRARARVRERAQWKGTTRKCE